MSLAAAIHAARRRHGLAEDAPVLLVPAHRGKLAPLPAARRRAFTRHLSEAIAEAFAAPAAEPRNAPAAEPRKAPPAEPRKAPPAEPRKAPAAEPRKAPPAEPRGAHDGIAAPLVPLVRAACACCRGQCCTRGGEHAYLDADTIRRLRRTAPGIGAGAILARYRAALGGETYEGSCVFHGKEGCKLERALRTDLCNSFHCTPLAGFLRAHDAGPPARSLILAGDDEAIRRSAAHRADPPVAAFAANRQAGRTRTGAKECPT
jgi:hypothetical protein